MGAVSENVIFCTVQLQNRQTIRIRGPRSRWKTNPTQYAQASASLRRTSSHRSPKRFSAPRQTCIQTSRQSVCGKPCLPKGSSVGYYGIFSPSVISSVPQPLLRKLLLGTLNNKYSARAPLSARDEIIGGALYAVVGSHLVITDSRPAFEPAF